VQHEDPDGHRGPHGHRALIVPLRPPWRRRVGIAIAVAAAALALAGGHVARQVILIGNGYVAKTVCSGVFISQRKAHAVRDAEILSNDPGLLRLVSSDVDWNGRAVRARFLGLAERFAVFRGPLGCTLAVDVTPRELAARTLPEGAPVERARWAMREAGGDPAAGIDAAAVDEAFAEPGPNPTRRTRAVVVVHDGAIAAERYAAGFGRDSALPGWSVTKSVVNALAGALVRQGRLALDAPVDVPEWSAPGDPRRAITLRQLLTMTSGLEFSESYANPLGDVLWMLFGTGSAAHFAAGKPLAAPPGERWYYSSGTTNILARALRRAVGGSDADYLTFPRRALFEPLGMATAVLEPDASGHFVGSSFMFASARDWARLGQLYLQDGVWEGKRLLPEGWVAFSTTPVPAARGGAYGAHFWLRLPAVYAPSGDAGLPPDAYHAVGFEGQLVTIVPSRKLVVVRLGLSVGPGAWDHAAFLRRLLRPGAEAR
jgi:CubicO group peptidase (beta-lactamase class C family)